MIMIEARTPGVRRAPPKTTERNPESQRGEGGYEQVAGEEREGECPPSAASSVAASLAGASSRPLVGFCLPRGAGGGP